MTIQELEAKLLTYAMGIKDPEVKKEFCKHFGITTKRQGEIKNPCPHCSSEMVTITEHTQMQSQIDECSECGHTESYP